MARAVGSGEPRHPRAAAALVAAGAAAAAVLLFCGRAHPRASGAGEPPQESLRLAEDAAGLQLFDCFEDLETWELVWPEPKKAFCCEKRWIGCSDAGASPSEAGTVDVLREFSSLPEPRAGAAAGADGAKKACRTALKGDPCYNEVRWAMRTGIHKHPQWYLGLSERSTFEEFQDFIYNARQDAPCHKPCAHPAPVAPGNASKPSHGNDTAPTSRDAAEVAASDELRDGKPAGGATDAPTKGAPTTTLTTAPPTTTAAPTTTTATKTTAPTTTTLQAAADPPDCHTAVDGEPCYFHVVWAMQVGLSQHPEWYDSLNEQSSMEEFQTHIHWNNPELLCDIPCASTLTTSLTTVSTTADTTTSTGEPLPTSTSARAKHRFLGRAPKGNGSLNTTHHSSTGTSTSVTATTTATEACETAAAGSECYQSVLWAAQVGTCQHPDWYPQLTKKSSFEAYQRHLHLTDQAQCPMPCGGETPMPPKPGATIFCFAVANEDYEMDIVRFQHERCAGIFDCTETAIVSQFPDAAGLPVLQIDWMNVGVSQDGFAANTEVFLQAWGAVRNDGRYASYDWTVKADPDCVLVPDRLRWRLGNFGVGNFYVANCDRNGGAPPMMYGAVEAISNEAVQAFFSEQDRCKNEMGWQVMQDWGEDRWLGACLDHIGVTRIDDYNLLHDQRCLFDADCHNEAAAFHPFKSTDSWAACWQATQEVVVAV